MPIRPEPLPYEIDALEPFMSARAVRAHRVLEQRIVVQVAELYARHELRDDDVTLMQAYDLGCAQDIMLSVFAREALNHAFFWRGLRPPSLRATAPTFFDLVRRTHGSIGELIRDGCGRADLYGPNIDWLWLVLDPQGMPTWYAGVTPFGPPLLAIDMAEHAFWLDYPAESVSGPSSCRQFVTTVLEHLVDWGTVEQRLARIPSRIDEQRALGLAGATAKSPC